MPDNHYEHPRLAAIYDADSGWSVDRTFYLELAGTKPIDILDVGCGTGLICRAYAERGHRVTGVDPSSAMLAVGRGKPHGDGVNWVEATAQSFQNAQRFDLIIMTGHAFQVLLEDEDVAQALLSIARHLKPEGRAVFESRNPSLDWGRIWVAKEPSGLPGVQMKQSLRILDRSGGRIRFERHYEFPDEVLLSTSELRFMVRDEIEAAILTAGLEIDNLYGDWDRRAFESERSPEMIFTVRLPD